MKLAQPAKQKAWGILLLLLGVSLVSAIVLLASREPTNAAAWQLQFRTLPVVSISEDLVEIDGVRDFRYHTDHSIAEARYINKRYRLSQLHSVWYGISHFGDNGLAHVMLSYGFRNELGEDDFLVVSIEARLREADTDGYQPVHGLFRAYHKTIVLATEEDVVGLRTHVRGERFYLYPLVITPLAARASLLNLLLEAELLRSQPVFYNSLIDNCMTGLLVRSQVLRGIGAWFDYRVLLPGYSDALAFEKGLLDTTQKLDVLRERHQVNPAVTRIGDPAFSQRIRGYD